MDPLVVVLGAFIATSLAAGISESRFYNALASAGTITSDAEVLRRFSEDPRGMPRINVRETRSRLRELVTRQPDAQIERLRRLALTWSIISGVVFLGNSRRHERAAIDPAGDIATLITLPSAPLA